jgi:hypothetical protein
MVSQPYQPPRPPAAGAARPTRWRAAELGIVQPQVPASAEQEAFAELDADVAVVAPMA